MGILYEDKNEKLIIKTDKILLLGYFLRGLLKSLL